MRPQICCRSWSALWPVLTCSRRCARPRCRGPPSVKVVPKRSNDFQKVIYYVRKHIAPDAVVRESVMLTDKITGEPREVDVLVEGTMGGERLAIAIEVRGHARKPGVQWVEEVRGKYQDLPVDKVVMVSRSGFTASALTKAASYGIEALTPLEEISRYGPLSKLTGIEVATRSVRGVRLVQGFVDFADHHEPVAVMANSALFHRDGTEFGTVEMVCNDSMSKPDAFDIYDVAKPEHTAYKFTLEGVLLTRGDTGETFTPHLRIQADGSLHPIKRLTTVWEVEVIQESIELKHGVMRGLPFAYGSIDISGEKRLVFVAGEQMGEPLTDEEMLEAVVQADGEYS